MSNAAQKQFEFYASCPEGFELALAEELRALGVRSIRRLKGRASFTGEVSDAYRVCLWSCLASRVFVNIARFDCHDAHDLYEGTRLVLWDKVLREGASIAVSARGTNDELRNSHFSALCVKDAICDYLAEKTGARPNVDVDNPDAHILLTLRGERASLQLDLSGAPLFKRLPQEASPSNAGKGSSKGSAAPASTHHVLRPDYAALLLYQAGWGKAVSTLNEAEDAPTPVLIDFACAGGGVELEAVNMLLNRAPGLSRGRWGFEGWALHDADAWQALVDEAAERAGKSAQQNAVLIAADVEGAAVEHARRLVRKTGGARHVTFINAGSQGVFDALERQGIVAGVPASFALVADTTQTSFKAQSAQLALAAELRGSELLRDAPAVVLATDDMISRAFGSALAATIGVKPNNEDAQLLMFSPASKDKNSPTAAPSTTLIDLGNGSSCPVLIPESEQFARRLAKVAKQRRKWAQRAGVSCYRVYDADLPDYSAAIDLYEGSAATPGRWLVIAEYAAPKHIDPKLAQARLLDILALAPRILQVEPEYVFAKARLRARGGSQYGKGSGGVNAAQKALDQSSAHSKAKGGKLHAHTQSFDAAPSDIRTRPLPLIEEGGLTFAVNFNDYLDTGIFLDHRVTRGLVREHARNKRWFLNLFAYTGTATCYAADAGVEETVTVDLSNTYLDWAERNMDQNGFTGPEHHFVRADVLAWIEDMRHTNNRWDLIFCDPPTFSNSSKMGERTWDVQRDHVELLYGISRLLTHDGEAIFSCNLRTFKPDVAALEELGIELCDISAQTIPEDFARNPRIHRCYIVRRA